MALLQMKKVAEQETDVKAALELAILAGFV
jgi:hypothetical protein